MYIGAYEFVEEQIELLGKKYIDALLDKGFEPVLIHGKGWQWVMPSNVKTTQKA